MRLAVVELDLKRVERWAWIFLAGAAAGSLLFGRQTLVVGLAVGGLISIINFRWLGFFYTRALARGTKRVKAFAVLCYAGRYMAVGAVLYLVISRRFADGVSLLAGVSIIYLVVAFYGFLRFSKRSSNCKGALGDG